MNVLLWTGGDAPNREATLKVGQWDEINHYYAYWDPGYCACEDCHPLVGEGATADEAIADYWERWTEKYGEAKADRSDLEALLILAAAKQRLLRATRDTAAIRASNLHTAMLMTAIGKP